LADGLIEPVRPRRPFLENKRPPDQTGSFPAVESCEIIRLAVSEYSNEIVKITVAK
jgi:hypothetical protein